MRHQGGADPFYHDITRARMYGVRSTQTSKEKTIESQMTLIHQFSVAHQRAS